MLLLKGTIKNPAYTSTTTDFVNACAEVLISNYMLLTPDDFEKWEDDPEAWVHSVDAENWEFELRPCAEATFLCLLSQNREQLCPIILNLVEKVATVNDYHALLLKDGVYAAIGLGVQSLYGRLDFENFVMNRLIPEVMNKDPTFKILRRRIAWVLGKWVTEGISADGRVAIYEALLQMMGEEEDLVVRITSAHSLKMAIDDWDFDISLLLPYLDRVMDGLLRLLAVVEESDTVMKLVSDLNTVMDRTGRETIPYASKIIQLLMPLWDRGQSEPLFQQALIVTFTKISAPAHVYLLEDALDLWWTLLQCAPNGNTQLFLLFPVAIDLMDYDTENLRKIFKIIESYLLLNHQLAVQQCGSALLSRLGYYVMNSREEVASSVAHIIDLFIKVTPLKSAADGLVQSGVLGNVLQTFLQGQMYAYALVTYMSLFARLAIHDANFVIQFITAAGQQLDPTAADFFGDVLDKWMDKVRYRHHSRGGAIHKRLIFYLSHLV
ncbi:armadillo-type protein [Radiomyces spectabilis]|uniref:armadillo-type protein n=1 Tax=Radiomyces spectabilis TaxID=64574 RepID=UPI00221E9BCF|nr:armadillo-type protein [Radiomyces spectabilis]KAI8373128.1 armadillo-type protein [Radiomyces spectabilis]